jgi:hypothetical protein
VTGRPGPGFGSDQYGGRTTATLGLAATGMLLRCRKLLDHDPSWEDALAISGQYAICRDNDIRHRASDTGGP